MSVRKILEFHEIPEELDSRAFKLQRDSGPMTQISNFRPPAHFVWKG